MKCLTYLFDKGIYLFVKFLILLIFLLVNLSVKSQVIKNFGIREDLSINIIHSEPEFLPAFTTSLTYNKNNWTFLGGPVISQRMIHTKEGPFASSLDKYFRISGFTLGSKYVLIQYSRTRTYCFIDNMLLTYNSFEHFLKFGDGISTIIDELQPLSRTLVLQPVIGSGTEIKFLKYFIFSAELGYGITYRHMEYGDNWNNYPTHRTAYILHMKLGLGFNFK